METAVTASEEDKSALTVRLALPLGPSAFASYGADALWATLLTRR
jgi:hypothetical protein